MNNLMQKFTDPRGVTIDAFDAREMLDLETALTGALGMEYDALQYLRSKTDCRRCAPSFFLECILCLSSMEGKQIYHAKDLLTIVEERNLCRRDADRLHLSACQKWVRQDFEGAHRDWRLVLATQPCDILALYGIHMLEFNMGWSVRMKETMQMVTGAWHHGMPLSGYVKGIEAFTLVENGDNEGAYIAARRALDVNPRDIYALHAVCHVDYETGRYKEAVAWLDSCREHWSDNPCMRIHIWWHHALFQLYMMDIDAVLSTFHEKIREKNNPDGYEDLDAVSLLWRLSLIGVDVSDLWHELAQYWMPGIDHSQYWFNDVHAMMAMTSSKHHVLAQRILRHVETSYSAVPRVAAVTKSICEGLMHFSYGDYDRAFTTLVPVMNSVSVIGGSNAQRDLLEMTVIEAALRCDRKQEAGHLMSTGRCLRHASPLRDLFVSRLYETQHCDSQTLFILSSSHETQKVKARIGGEFKR